MVCSPPRSHLGDDHCLTGRFVRREARALNITRGKVFKILERIIAQIDVTFSNSLIESWWRSLKHGWLFINHLDDLVTLRKLVEFDVTEHNQTMPHSAFSGQTPDEMYFGGGEAVPDELATRRREARRSRVAQNRNIVCCECCRSEAALGAEVAA